MPASLRAVGELRHRLFDCGGADFGALARASVRWLTVSCIAATHVRLLRNRAAFLRAAHGDSFSVFTARDLKAQAFRGFLGDITRTILPLTF